MENKTKNKVIFNNGPDYDPFKEYRDNIQYNLDPVDPNELYEAFGGINYDIDEDLYIDWYPEEDDDEEYCFDWINSPEEDNLYDPNDDIVGDDPEFWEDFISSITSKEEKEEARKRAEEMLCTAEEEKAWRERQSEIYLSELEQQLDDEAKKAEDDKVLEQEHKWTRKYKDTDKLNLKTLIEKPEDINNIKSKHFIENAKENEYIKKIKSGEIYNNHKDLQAANNHFIKKYAGLIPFVFFRHYGIRPVKLSGCVFVKSTANKNDIQNTIYQNRFNLAYITLTQSVMEYILKHDYKKAGNSKEFCNSAIYKIKNAIDADLRNSSNNNLNKQELKRMALYNKFIKKFKLKGKNPSLKEIVDEVQRWAIAEIAKTQKEKPSKKQIENKTANFSVATLKKTLWNNSIKQIRYEWGNVDEDDKESSKILDAISFENTKSKNLVHQQEDEAFNAMIKMNVAASFRECLKTLCTRTGKYAGLESEFSFKSKYRFSDKQIKILFSPIDKTQKQMGKELGISQEGIRKNIKSARKKIQNYYKLTLAYNSDEAYQKIVDALNSDTQIDVQLPFEISDFYMRLRKLYIWKFLPANEREPASSIE